MTVIERAMQLARDGKHRSVAEIRQTLIREQYESVAEHTNGLAIKGQLTALILAARKTV